MSDNVNVTGICHFVFRTAVIYYTYLNILCRSECGMLFISMLICKRYIWLFLTHPPMRKTIKTNVGVLQTSNKNKRLRK